jgi:hypothetical protein
LICLMQIYIAITYYARESLIYLQVFDIYLLIHF